MVAFLVVCLSLLLCLQPMASAGTLLAGGGSPGGSPGTWYVGATPPNVDYTKPVLVFIHGKGGWSGSWWQETVYHGTNDMYNYAYNNGYRTAFVDLHPNLDMWVNGQLLSQKLNEITAYFGVPKVTIVAHSKGGVDTNSASVHYGASAKITRVITLGSPHGGTPVADMAYSTWTWWLAALLGERNDATYVMQTGYMSYFRSVTDGRDTSVPYYTVSGYKCGPVFTALWMGCGAISGEDDGLVPVWSARKPGATHLKEGYWDHDEIRMGSRVWSWISPVMLTAGTGSQAVAAVGPKLAAAGGQPTDAGRADVKPEAPGNLLLRGGTTTEHGTATFPVESGVRGANFTFLASSPDFTATLVGPDGTTQAVTMAEQVDSSQVFGGAWFGTVNVASPAAGQWTLQAASGSEAGYLMIADLDSDLKASLDLGNGPVVEPGSKQSLKLSFKGKAPAHSRAEAAIALAGQQAHGRPAFSQAGGVHAAQFTVPAGNGIHNVTVTVIGTLADGTAFERSVITSFAAVASGDRGTWK